ncbi:MAG: hypothetical protein WAM60_06715, partial [Candidatus Promineifilaceae bacterium]
VPIRENSWLLISLANLPPPAKILYNSGMAQQVSPVQSKNALTAALLSQFRKPHELTKITLLLLVLAHTRMRAGFSLHEPQPAKVPDTNRPQRVKRKKGFSIKRPRTRFL